MFMDLIGPSIFAALLYFGMTKRDIGSRRRQKHQHTHMLLYLLSFLNVATYDRARRLIADQYR
jgi:hypothetical protein